MCIHKVSPDITFFAYKRISKSNCKTILENCSIHWLLFHLLSCLFSLARGKNFKLNLVPCNTGTTRTPFSMYTDSRVTVGR